MVKENIQKTTLQSLEMYHSPLTAPSSSSPTLPTLSLCWKRAFSVEEGPVTKNNVEVWMGTSLMCFCLTLPGSFVYTETREAHWVQLLWNIWILQPLTHPHCNSHSPLPAAAGRPDTMLAHWMHSRDSLLIYTHYAVYWVHLLVSALSDNCKEFFPHVD